MYHFTEKQRFTEISFYILLGIIQAIFLWGFIQQVIFEKPWGTNPGSNTTLILCNIGILVLILFIVSITIKTEITEQGISFKMFPFHLTKRTFAWSTIKFISVVKYNAIREYFGWGFRYMPKKGWCYTLSGECGIKIELMNGKTILIGTHKADEIKHILGSLKNKGVIKTPTANQ